MKLEELIGEDYLITGSGRYLRTREHDSLVIDTKEQIFYWNSKAIFGTAFDWLTKVKGVSRETAAKRLKQAISVFDSATIKKESSIEQNDKPVPFADLVDIFYERGKNNKDYWLNYRGYTEETIENFKLGFSGWCYTIPVYVDGIFRNFQCRIMEPKASFSWYKNTGPLPFHFSVLRFNDWVVLTEGPPDAIMLTQNGIPALSHTGAAGYWNNEWINYFITKKLIYVVYDNDEAGKYGSKKVSEALGIGRTKIYNMWDFPDKYDITDYFKNGGTREEFLNILKKKSKFGFQLGEQNGK